MFDTNRILGTIICAGDTCGATNWSILAENRLVDTLTINRLAYVKPHTYHDSPDKYSKSQKIFKFAKFLGSTLVRMNIYMTENVSE